jgi:hypothetical protein
VNLVKIYYMHVWKYHNETLLQLIYTNKKGGSTGLVVHVYNPSYLGSRDWEDCGSRPAGAK